MDLTAVKAELKAWEREFKSKNGREPSKSDIKAVPEIAEKYRLYSKARADKPASAAPSKQAQSIAATAVPPPVTPSKRAAKHRQQQEDSFKTPSRSSAARAEGSGHAQAGNGAEPSPTANGNGNTQFAYAPSPSRLRALAASRSFSGSPNKKGGLAAREEAKNGMTNAPVNLGKSFVLPPTVDTPRTKAKRWLAGDAVSPPVKLRYNTQAGSSAIPQASTSGTKIPAKRTNGSKPDFWQQVEQRRSATPAESVPGGEVVMQGHVEQDNNGALPPANGHEEDGDLLAPSPVKPASQKVNGKGKQRQRIDLFGSSSLDSSAETTMNGKASGSLTHQKIAPTPITSFFSAKPPLRHSNVDNPESDKKPYIPGPSKAKKRTIGAAAIVPNTSEDFDKIEEADVAPVQLAKGKQKAKERSLKSAKSPTIEEDEEVTAGPSERTKRLRKEVVTAQSSGHDEKMQEQDPDQYEDAYDEEVFEALQAQHDDDYETRDLSDEYEEYAARHRSTTPAMLLQTARETSSAPLDESIDPDLVSLLSLKTSPVKNRLAKLQKKREDTYRKLLHEPTYLMESKRRITGLEDLEEEEQRKREAELELKHNAKPIWSAESSDDDPLGLKKGLDGEDEEHSDDDWASEPEGWKDLSDGEMPDDSL